MGTAPLLAYVLLKMGADRAFNRRQDSFTACLRALRSKLAKMNLSFFSTDKTGSQMFAIRNAFCMYPLLCLWHLRRALKSKILELRKVGICDASETFESLNLHLVDEQYFLVRS